ncbi:CoA pyrophosphatase [Granulosicoccaceae sp. 1_MG-2023]|nr:CoA pyrophosphatase [Granulosicoccaceae sp. 1_MG-2023]
MAKQYAQPGFLQTSDLPLANAEALASARKAAVLAPLLKKQDQWHVLYIRRAEREGDRHSGQVAFPGGKVDPGDISLRHTALREANEEIGLESRDVDVIAELPTYHTISNFTIYPVVGRIPWPVDLTPEVCEVARIFTIPLDWLHDEANYYLKTHPLNPREPGRPHPASSRTAAVHYKPYQGEILWGATARMTLGLLKALDEGEIVLD